MKTKIQLGYGELSFTDSDVCNPDDAVWQGEYNPHNTRLWVLHDHGFTLCVVWADNLCDALDIAADSGKLNKFALLSEKQLREYTEDSIDYLGNDGAPYDIDNVDCVELPAPKLSLVALCNVDGRDYFA